VTDRTTAQPPRNRPAEAGLQRRIGLFGASVSGVAIVLGAGIYVLVGEAAGIAGNGVWMSFMVAAVLATGTGFAYAELTTMFPEAGAAAAYAEEAFGPRVGFVTGWMDVVVNSIAAPAVALGFGSYLGAMIDLDPTVIAVGVLLLCGLVVLTGVSQTVGLAGLFALIEVAGLLFVITVGLPSIGSVNVFEVQGAAGGLLGAAALVFFAYEGFEEVATLSEEVKDPTRTIPIALMLAIGVTTAIYALVSLVVVSVVPWQELGESRAPLALVVERLVGPTWANGISFVALFATFNTVLLVLATGPRAMYGMARRGLLPPVMGWVWAARGTPWVSILGATAVAVAFALSGDIAFVAQVTNFAVFTLFIAVNGSVLRLRFTQPDRARPFRIRPSLGRVPLAPVVGLVGALVLSVFMERSAFLVGCAALLLGFALSFVLVQHEARPDAD